MAYYVYLLESFRDNKRYIGITNNLDRRFKQHNTGQVPSTRNRLPMVLKHVVKCPDRLVARKREKYFKTAAGRRFLDRTL